jgi:hypothetical protein
LSPATLTRPTAREKLTDPLNARRPATVEPPLPPVEIRKLLLRGKTLSADIAAAVTGGELERTIEGASTLTLSLHDPEKKLVSSDALEGNVDLKLDRFWFRLTRTAKDGDTITLTFEDREVAWLRGYTEPRRAYRDRSTRAEFVLSLLREVKEGRVRLVCPELHKRQPVQGIKSSRDRPSKRKKDTERSKGIAKGAKLTVKGRRADSEQLRNIERALDVAHTLKAPTRASLALIEACIQESLFRNLKSGDASSTGILQVLSSTGQGVGVNPRDVEAVVGEFLRNGYWKYRPKGAIELAKQNPSWSPGQIAQACQGSAHPGSYEIHRKEANAILKAYGGGEIEFGESSRSVVVSKRYGFTRGTVKKRENSWEAIQRLAEEVSWRAFMVEGALYFISEEDLYRSRPRFVLSERSPGVKEINFELDRNLKVSEARILCRADLWEADPGTVVELEQCGPANGRWLVSTMRRGIWDRETEILLRKPMKERPEPAPETEEREVSGLDPKADSESSGEVRQGKGGRLEGGSAYDRFYAACESISKKSAGYSYGGGHGPRLSSLSDSQKLDCSSSTSLALYRAGLMGDGTSLVSGGFSGWGKPGPGKKFTVYYNAGHVFTELYGRPMKRFDTGGGEPRGPRLRSTHRGHGGFAARHYPGL